MAVNLKKICAFLTFYSCALLILKLAQSVQPEEVKEVEELPDLTVELVDGKWDQIQKGQWLIGFFDKETKESLQLEEDWQVFALKCKEQDINVARVFAPKNPGLYVRFLVTVFPKVFYVKNGVAHEVKQPNRETLVNVIKNQRWKELKPVNFLSNPFSVQMSLLSHLFVHAVNLYNYEDTIVQKFVPFSSATDVAFALTFIVVGTFLGLLLTCAFGLVQVFFFDSKDPEEEEEAAQEDKSPQKSAEQSEGDATKEETVKKSASEEEENTSVRKRKV